MCIRICCFGLHSYLDKVPGIANRVTRNFKDLLLDICKYYTQNNIVIFHKQSKTYVSILIDTSRIMKRFRMNMYSGVKTIVYKQLYDFYYMTNINFDDVGF